MNPRYNELFEALHHSPMRQQIPLLEELIRLADADNDTETAFDARFELSRIANETGFPEKAIVAFSWCLGQFDKNPEQFDWHQILWRYKVILEWIPVFARVSRDKIIDMQEDMARRLTQFGESERTAHYYRSWNFMRMGDYDTALNYQKTYLDMPRGPLSDCLACERDREIELLCRMQDDAEAVIVADPILSGSMSCGEVPEFTNGHIVRSFIRLGMMDEAKERQVFGYNSIQQEQKYLGTVGDLMIVPIRLRDFETAIPQMVRHLPWAVETAADELRFRFYLSCGLLMEALSSAHPESRQFRIPRELPFWKEDDTYSPAELAEWFSSESRTLAEQFNQRNGNSRYDEIISERRSLCELN